MKDFATRRPADRTAARVTQPGPIGYESARNPSEVCSAVPLPLRPLPSNFPPPLAALVGQQFGRLTVVGLTPKRKRACHSAQWSCRCACGYYVVRTTHALQNPFNRDEGCDRCRQVQRLRRQSTYQQTGVYPPED